MSAEYLFDTLVNQNSGEGCPQVRSTFMPYLQKGEVPGQRIWTTSIIGTIGDPFDYTHLFNIMDTAVAGDTIRLILDTQGGRVDTAAMIANSLLTTKARTVAIANGQVMSSASTLIFPACSSWEIRAGANFMFHGTTHAQQGKSMAIRDYALTVIDYIAMCLTLVKKLGILTDDEYNQIFEKKATIFMTGQTIKERMLQKGLAVA